MKKIFFKLALLTALFASNTYAADNDTLSLQLTNNTSHTLVIYQIIGGNPGNTFDMEPNVLAPFQSALVTAKITKDFDLCATIDFLDEGGKDENFWVLDPRAFHDVQPIFNFSINNPIVKAKIHTINYTDNPHPKDLLISKVDIEILPAH